MAASATTPWKLESFLDSLILELDKAQDTLALEFDQSIRWTDTLAGQFYLDGAKDKVASGNVAGNVLTLKLKEPAAAKQITYLKEITWSQDTLLIGANGLAALTFCEVPIAASKAAR